MRRVRIELGEFEVAGSVIQFMQTAGGKCDSELASPFVVSPYFP